MNKLNYVNEDKGTVWDSIFSNLGSWLSGAADITRASKGTPEEVNYVQVSSGNDKKSMIYIGIGALALIIILFFLFKK